MNFYVSGISGVQSSVASLSATEAAAEIMASIMKSSSYSCSSGLIQEYAEVFAQGEKIIIERYKSECRRLGQENAPSIDFIRDEYAESNPEYAVARRYCMSVHREHEDYISKKMRKWDRQHPINPWGTDAFYREQQRMEYLRRLEREYRDSNPAYDIIKTEEEMQDIYDEYSFMGSRKPTLREISLL